MRLFINYFTNYMNNIVFYLQLTLFIQIHPHTALQERPMTLSVFKVHFHIYMEGMQII